MLSYSRIFQHFLWNSMCGSMCVLLWVPVSAGACLLLFGSVWFCMVLCAQIDIDFVCWCGDNGFVGSCILVLKIHKNTQIMLHAVPDPDIGTDHQRGPLS